MVQVLFHFNRNIQPKKNRDSVIVIICVHIQRAEAEAKKTRIKSFISIFRMLFAICYFKMENLESYCHFRNKAIKIIDDFPFWMLTIRFFCLVFCEQLKISENNFNNFALASI